MPASPSSRSNSTGHLPDMDRKYDEIIREMNRLRPDLPAAVSSVTIRKGQPGLTNIVQFALVGDVAYRELTDRARDLKDLLEGVNGVRQVEVWGAPDPEVRVALNLARMSRLERVHRRSHAGHTGRKRRNPRRRPAGRRYALQSQNHRFVQQPR